MQTDIKASRNAEALDYADIRLQGAERVRQDHPDKTQARKPKKDRHEKMAR